MTNELPPDIKRAQLERENRRCDGNNRTCSTRATERHTVKRADGFGNALPDAIDETRQTCSNHRRQFVWTGVWKHIATVRLPDVRGQQVTFSADAA